jgi:diguanylate cyclase (GGDEF)-like protein
MNGTATGESATTGVVDFATYYQQRTRMSACLLFAFTCVNGLLFPLFRSAALDIPVMQPRLLLLEWGVLVPVSAAAIVLRLKLRDAWLSEIATLVAIGLIGCLIAVSTYWWHAAGRNLPLLANALLLTAAAATCGVDYRRLSAVATFALLLEVVVAYETYGASIDSHQAALFLIPSTLVIFVVAWQVQRAVWQTWDEGRYFQQLSERDPLTGLLNRRAFEARARGVLARAAREQRPVVMALLDFDRFAHFNDVCGRQGGDRALKVFARLLSRYARQPLDLVARLGEEEFVLLWFDVGEQWGRSRAAVVGRAVREMDVGLHMKAPPPLTASIGAICADGAQAPGLTQLLHETDANLRAAKKGGGDRVVLTAVGESPPDAPPGPALQARTGKAQR